MTVSGLLQIIIAMAAIFLLAIAHVPLRM